MIWRRGRDVATYAAALSRMRTGRNGGRRRGSSVNVTDESWGLDENVNRWTDVRTGERPRRHALTCWGSVEGETGRKRTALHVWCGGVRATLSPSMKSISGWCGGLINNMMIFSVKLLLLSHSSNWTMAALTRLPVTQLQRFNITYSYCRITWAQIIVIIKYDSYYPSTCCAAFTECAWKCELRPKPAVQYLNSDTSFFL